MARTITITDSPQEVIPANPQRDVLEILNHGEVTIFLRHGGTLDLSVDAACGIPLAPKASRALSGIHARSPVSAAVESGQPPAVLYFHEFLTS